LFETRLHTISEDDALNRRKVWEGFIQWANNLSGVGSDNIARDQFGPDDFQIDSFIEMHSAGFDKGSLSAIINGSHGSVAISKSFTSLDLSGDYWMDWSVSMKLISGGARWVCGIPFIGNHFFGSAQDFRAQMGFYQNGEVTATRHWSGADDASDPPGSDDGSKGNMPADEWKHGYYGRKIAVAKGVVSYAEDRNLVPREGAGDGQEDYYHLSGSGCASAGRVTGNMGVIILGQDGSEFEVESGHMSLRRRVR